MNLQSTIDLVGDAYSELTRAQSLIALQDFATAARIYEKLLTAGLSEDLRIEAQANLAAALCAMAQDESTSRERALDQLDQARALQTDMLSNFSSDAEPLDWASGRANLALIHLSRYKISGGEHDVLLAHLALDGVEVALRRADNVEMLDWIDSIRDYLLDLRDRRGKGR